MSACAKAHALVAETPKMRSPRSRTTSFARSRDPCTSIATELPRRKSWEVARSVRYRGRANLRKQEEPAPGSERTDGCAACRASPPRKRVVRDASEKEGGHGLRPCEETRAPVGDRTSCSLQKSAGRVLVPNKLARSAPKRVAVRVNGGLDGEVRGVVARKRCFLSYVVAERIAGASGSTGTLMGIAWRTGQDSG